MVDAFAACLNLLDGHLSDTSLLCPPNRVKLNYSTLRKWRDARDKAAYEALENKKPGPTATEPHPAEVRVAELERENQRLREELTKAKVIIDVQKKVSELLGLSPQDESSETS